MYGRIEHGNNLVIDLDRIGNPDIVLGKNMRKGFSEGGFAGSRRSVKEDGRTGVEGGTELAQPFRIDH